jgi:hypothetical protein
MFAEKSRTRVENLVLACGRRWQRLIVRAELQEIATTWPGPSPAPRAGG